MTGNPKLARNLFQLAKESTKATRKDFTGEKMYKTQTTCGVEIFDREFFESKLPVGNRTKKPLWTVEIVGDEYQYTIGTRHPNMLIKVRSSVSFTTDKSKSDGQDSIRIWLESAKTGKPKGGRLSRWITRKPGWERRMWARFKNLGQLLDELQTLPNKGYCPQCGDVLGIYLYKKGDNKGKSFARCMECQQGWHSMSWEK